MIIQYNQMQISPSKICILFRRNIKVRSYELHTQLVIKLVTMVHKMDHIFGEICGKKFNSSFSKLYNFVHLFYNNYQLN